MLTSPPFTPLKEEALPNSDAFLNSLVNASKFIEVVKDKLPDLADLLNRSVPTNDPTRSGYGTDLDFKYPLLEKERSIPLPDALFEQYDLMQCKCFMGLFPEISRAWVTIDHRLFLWDYEKEDFCLFEDQDQIIVSVGLVKPIPGVFIEEIKYIMVISTPIEVMLLGIGFNEQGDISLYNTNMSVSADGVNMTSIVGSDQGRIFMSGSNGNLYELVYQADEGWFTRKCRKVNLSSSRISMLVPSFISWTSSVPITSISIDNERKILYVLDEKSNIEAIYLGADGKEFNRIGQCSNILTSAQRLLEPYPYSGIIDARTFKIVSINVVSTKESALIHLVAMTSTGARLYLSTNQERGYFGNQNQPSTLRLISVVRPYPPSQSGGTGALNAVRVHVGYYKQGLSLMANAVSDDLDSIVGINMDLGTISQAPNVFAEQYSSLYIEGKTWAIAEATSKPVKSQFGEFLNEFSTQFSSQSRRIVVLTNSGITLLKKRRPIDVLQSFLQESGGQASVNLQSFFQSVGFEQACAMCLALACGHPTIQMARPENIAMSPRLKNRTVALSAKKLFFELGGKPLYRGQLRDQLVSNGMIEYSGRQRGLTLYITRLVSSIYKTGLFKSDKQGKQLLQNISVQDLLQVQRGLEALASFLNENSHFVAPPNPAAIERERLSLEEAEALQVEQQSLYELDLLVKNMIEGISLILLLFDHPVSSLVKSVQERQALIDLTFESLVSTIKGRDTGKQLMMQLVNKQIENQIDVGVISDLLRQRCPYFCSPNDVVLYKGTEILKRAKVNQFERRELMKECFTLFSGILQYLSFEKLEEIVEQFRYLKDYSDGCELALLFAKKHDPLDLGLEFFKQGQPLNDPRQEFLTVRRKCYQLVFSVIEMAVQMDPSINKNELYSCLNSQDSLFHHDFYTWLIENGRQDQVLSLNTRYIEAFLIDKARQHVEIADLLWRFYVEKGEFMKSAGVLFEIANLSDESLTLKQRLEYLTRASANSKASTRMLNEEETLLVNEIQESLEVAQIQLEIYQSIESMSGYDHLLPELDKELLDITALFKGYARPLELNETILLILYTSNYQDKYMVESCWDKIIASVDLNKGSSRLSEALALKVSELGRRYLTNDNVFPVEIVVTKVLCYAYEHGDSSVGWLTRALLNIGVEHLLLFNVYNELFESKQSPWNTSNSTSLLLHTISDLVESWLSTKSVPFKYLDEKISQYLLTNLPNDTTGTISRLSTIQSKLRKL